MVRRARFELAPSRVEAARASCCASGGRTWSIRPDSNRRRRLRRPTPSSRGRSKNGGDGETRTRMSLLAGQVPPFRLRPRSTASDSNRRNRGCSSAPSHSASRASWSGRRDSNPCIYVGNVAPNPSATSAWCSLTESNCPSRVRSPTSSSRGGSDGAGDRIRTDIISLEG